jgi:hypothetical protein
MVDFEFADGYAKLPRDARQRGYHDVDQFIADSAELIIALRDAREAHAAARGKPGEWNSFSREIHRAQRGDAPLDVMIAEARSWASRWWRRASARNHRPAAEEQR